MVFTDVLAYITLYCLHDRFGFSINEFQSKAEGISVFATLQADGVIADD